MITPEQRDALVATSIRALSAETVTHRLIEADAIVRGLLGDERDDGLDPVEVSQRAAEVYVAQWPTP